MRRRERNNYFNVAIRRLIRLQNAIMLAKRSSGLAAVIEIRLLESTLDAVRFEYGQPSTWDVFKWRAKKGRA